jgi:alkaline phosphatase D
MSQLERRRNFLKLSVLGAAAVPIGCYREGREPDALTPEESARYFPQSVASGDPRPNSVVLWVRLEDGERPRADAELELHVALDPQLKQPVTLAAEALALAVRAEDDHCLTVRVSGLEPSTTYYYRFSYATQNGTAHSRVGRTRTAPAPTADATPRFAVICCQDFNGKYFHVARHVAEQDVDFVLHLGDYIYESAGDPTFQTPTPDRSVELSAPEEALELGRGATSYLVAQSLSNYRDLYKRYRGDPDLQALHERHPVIAIWDDHEFSDDCHGDVATYSDGQRDEASPERRAAADRAWSEYMPVDWVTAPVSRYDAKADFPENLVIYRSFVFGRHLELLLTDLRRFRPDHLIPEDAPPGAVFLTQAELIDGAGDLPEDVVPYVDIEALAGGAYRDLLLEHAEGLAVDAGTLRGNVSAVWINGALEQLGAQATLPPIAVDDPELERGYAYHCLLKNSRYSRVGSRYVVAVRPFEALAAKRWRESDGQSERLMGDDQREWFLETLRESTRTFKIWGSEIALQSRHIDLTGFAQAPAELQRRIAISAEDWDGFPNERRALLTELSRAGNVVILSGDLHCFFAGTPFVEGDEETRVIELTTGSVSSTTWLDGIEGSLDQDGSIPMEVQALVQNVDALLADPLHRPNPHLAYRKLDRNGYSLVEVSEEAVAMTIHSIATKHVATAPRDLSAGLDELFETERFRTRAGSAELEWESDGEFLTWSREKMAFL